MMTLATGAVALWGLATLGWTGVSLFMNEASEPLVPLFTSMAPLQGAILSFLAGTFLICLLAYVVSVISVVLHRRAA